MLDLFLLTLLATQATAASYSLSPLDAMLQDVSEPHSFQTSTRFKDAPPSAEFDRIIQDETPTETAPPVAEAYPITRRIRARSETVSPPPPVTATPVATNPRPQSLPPVVPPRVPPSQSSPNIQQFTPVVSAVQPQPAHSVQSQPERPQPERPQSQPKSVQPQSVSPPPEVVHSRQKMSPIVESPSDGMVRPILDGDMPAPYGAAAQSFFGPPSRPRSRPAFVTRGLIPMVKGTVPFGQIRRSKAQTRMGWPIGGTGSSQVNPMGMGIGMGGMYPQALNPMFG